jgi:hypothetical protein
MKIETTFLKPSILTFFRVFSLTLITLLSIKTIVSMYFLYVLVEPRLLIILSIGLSIDLTIGVRKFRLTLAEIDDLDGIKHLIVLNLTNNGLRIREENEHVITMESINRISNFFNIWFGTESTTIRQIDKKIIVEGHSRQLNNLVDAVDSRLRTGKSLN